MTQELNTKQLPLLMTGLNFQWQERLYVISDLKMHLLDKIFLLVCMRRLFHVMPVLIIIWWLNRCFKKSNRTNSGWLFSQSGWESSGILPQLSTRTDKRAVLHNLVTYDLSTPNRCFGDIKWKSSDFKLFGKRKWEWKKLYFRSFKWEYLIQKCINKFPCKPSLARMTRNLARSYLFCPSKHRRKVSFRVQ